MSGSLKVSHMYNLKSHKQRIFLNVASNNSKCCVYTHNIQMCKHIYMNIVCKQIARIHKTEKMLYTDLYVAFALKYTGRV